MQGAEDAPDLHGLHVEVCARVMGLAQGGQILMTRAVFDSARHTLKGEDLEGVAALNWVSHGRYLLKGLDEPLEICEVAESGQEALRPPDTTEKARRHTSPEEEPVLGWRPAAKQPVGRTDWVLEEKLGEGGFGEVWVGRHRTAPCITSLAVKPLDDFSGDTNNAYLSDGMTEALCSALGNISALRVPRRSSVMRYKGGQKSIQEMARELKVDAVVEGSIIRASSRIQVTARLIDAYGASPGPEDGRLRLDIRFRFERAGTRGWRRHGKPLVVRGAVGESMGLVLPIGDWPLGDYRVGVEVIDRVAGREAEGWVAFRVVE